MGLRLPRNFLLLIALLAGSLVGCTPRAAQDAGTLTVLSTNDEHG